MNNSNLVFRSEAPNTKTSADVEQLSRVIESGAVIDLHSHSRHSDGDWTPESLIADAAELGLQLISLTDHDTVAGQAAAAAAAREAGLLYITGMEVSLTIDGRLYHVLCYDYEPSSPTWQHFAELRRQRFDLFYENQFQQLRDRGYAVDPELARDANGHFESEPLAIAVHRSGQYPTFEEAQKMIRGLGLRRPTDLLYQNLDDFASILRSGDAVFSVAHPARQDAGVSVRLSPADLEQFVAKLPLVALEAFHPYHREPDVAIYRELASTHSLAVTCGSDAHGVRFGRPLRRNSATLSEAFLRLIRERWLSRIPVPVSSN